MKKTSMELANIANELSDFAEDNNWHPLAFCGASLFVIDQTMMNALASIGNAGLTQADIDGMSFHEVKTTIVQALELLRGANVQ